VKSAWLLSVGCACIAYGIFSPQLIYGSFPNDVQANGNTHPAGRLAAGTLTLRLEIRDGTWNPEGENGPRIPVQAFAEEGQPLLNPGPLIRVPVGTLVRITAHNLLRSTKVVIHGLHSHEGGSATTTVMPLRTEEIAFRAACPGVYLYWGTTTGVSLDKRIAIESQLSGAIVVDPPRAVSEPDRVFVLGHWDQPGDPKAIPPKPELESWVINGKSWPQTERLVYPLRQRVHWNLINGTDENHPLHLHGQYFLVEATGDEKHWTQLSVALRRQAVTEVLPSGNSFAVSWLPQHAGNWLFHCHVLFHVAPELRQTPDPTGARHDEHDPTRHMAGLVLGVTVTGSEPVSSRERLEPRRLRLVIGQRTGNPLHGYPPLGYQLLEAHQKETPGAFTAPGPAIVLVRGEPVEIAVENRLATSTSVHWHGIELASYYDGVPGWGGEGKHVTPPIHSGETFIARFTPPRSGTFMYHTHLNDFVQLSTGLYGALIVLDPGNRLDPESDKIFVLSRGGTDDEKDPFLINGSASPAPMKLVAGKRYHFRFIAITPALYLRVTLDREGQHEVWRAIAKDGATLPAAQAVRESADVQMYPGETYDFEFQSPAAGELRLTASQPEFKLETAMRVHVRTQ
jgi:FtsP/CotA-like multicopper oxidase with cupredoxin domain